MSASMNFKRQFVPTDLTGCRLWLDATDPAGTGVPPSNGTLIPSWKDKSGVANNGTSVGAGGTFTSNQLNGNPGIVLGTTGLYYNLAQPTQFSSGQTAGLSYFVVVKVTGGTDGAYAVFTGGTVSCSKTGFTTYFLPGDGFWSTLWCGDASTFMSNATFPTANSLISNVYTNTGTGAYTNNTWLAGNPFTTTGSTATGVNLNNSVAAVGVGAGSGSFQATGTYYEIIYYNSTLSTQNRQKVEAYLAQKWGLIGQLPSSHPGRKLSALIPLARYIPLSTFFRPTQIIGCQLWLDGADINGNGSAVTNGAQVTTWVDKSANVYNPTQATSGKRPTVITNALNGLSGVAFLASSNQELATAALSAFNSLAGWTVFCILKPTWTAGDPVANPAFWGMRSGGSSKLNYYFMNNYSQISTFNGSGVINHSTGGTGPYIGKNVVTLVCLTNNGTTDIAYPNGQAGDSISQSFGGGQTIPICIGGDNMPGESWQGNIHEVIFYSRVITQAERQKIEAYLAQKWGLTASLPSTHPNNGVGPSMKIKPPFSPAFLPDLYMWYDTQDAASMIWSGSNLVSIADKSPLGQTANAVGNLTATTINGKTALNFNGTANLLTALSSTLTNSTISIFWTGQWSNTTATFGRFFSFGQATGNDWDNSGRVILTRYIAQDKVYPNKNYNMVAYDLPFNTRVTCGLVFRANNTASSYLNGVLIATDTVPTIALSVTQIAICDGTGASSGTRLTGKVGEFIIVRGEISNDNLVALTKYLNSRW